MSKENLLNEVWAEQFVEENSVDKCVSAIRQALGERREGRKFIETVRGRGYRFVGELRRVEIKEKPSENLTDSNVRSVTSKIVDNHRYAREREENVPAIADWQIKGKSEESIANLAAQSDGANQHFPPAGQTVSSLTSIAVLPFSDLRPPASRWFFLPL